MCPIQFRAESAPGQPRAFMDFSVFCRLIDQLSEATELQLQGLGEPLMHPRFFDMVRHAAERGMRVSTNTNLTLLSAQRARECVDSGLDTMHVSLDGASKATYEAIRVRARFETVLRNLRRLKRAKEDAQSELPHIRLIAVVMRGNLHELAELVRLAHEEGIDTLSVQHLCHDFGESSLPERYRPMRLFVEGETLLHEDLDLVRHYFDAARAAAYELNVTLRLPNVQPRTHAPGPPGTATLRLAMARSLYQL